MLKRFLVILGVVSMMGITMGCEPPENMDEYEEQGQQQQQEQGYGQDEGGDGFD
ncbi:MAG: hypothetical protein ACQETG_07030 [Thermodesulfobacteriota bacterium]